MLLSLRPGCRLPHQEQSDFRQHFNNERFIAGEFVGGEFESYGSVVVRLAQVIEKTGQREDTVTGDKVLPAMSVVGEVDVPDPS